MSSGTPPNLTVLAKAQPEGGCAPDELELGGLCCRCRDDGKVDLLGLSPLVSHGQRVQARDEPVLCERPHLREVETHAVGYPAGDAFRGWRSEDVGGLRAVDGVCPVAADREVRVQIIAVVVREAASLAELSGGVGLAAFALKNQIVHRAALHAASLLDRGVCRSRLKIVKRVASYRPGLRRL